MSDPHSGFGYDPVPGFRSWRAGAEPVFGLVDPIIGLLCGVWSVECAVAAAVDEAEGGDEVVGVGEAGIAAVRSCSLLFRLFVSVSERLVCDRRDDPGSVAVCGVLQLDEGRRASMSSAVRMARPKSSRSSLDDFPRAAPGPGLQQRFYLQLLRYLCRARTRWTGGSQSGGQWKDVVKAAEQGAQALKSRNSNAGGH